MKKVCFLLAIFLFGCAGPASKQSSDTAGENDAVLPVVTDERTDLVLSWFVDGGAETGNSVADVPDSAKKKVRVQDPSIPPEKASLDTVFLADLTAPKKNGRYAVKAVPRGDFEAERRAEAKKAAAAVPGNSLPPTVNIPPGASKVLMYATKHCPVCVKARRWLLEQKIPYIEKDLEADASASAELQKKGAAQGVPVRGVPVFDVYGRLIPGFDPARIIALLNQGPKAAKAPLQTI